MGRLIKLFLQLVISLLIIFLFTVALICLDGLVDQGEKADAGLVLCHPEGTTGKADPLLDRVAKLYKDGAFILVIVSEPATDSGEDKSGDAAKYLASHGVDSSAIVEDHSGRADSVVAKKTASIMEAHQLQSVMVVGDYYRITRMKLTLIHEGVRAVDKAHVGALRKEDAISIVSEVFAIYDYVARTIVLPMITKVKDEAQVEVQKAKVDAGKAKDKLDKGLDNLPK